MATGRLDGFTGRFSLVVVLMCLAVLWLGCIKAAVTANHRGFSMERTKNRPCKLNPVSCPVFTITFSCVWRAVFRAFCLSVTGFTNPPIGQALVAGHSGLEHRKHAFNPIGVNNHKPSRRAYSPAAWLGGGAMPKSTWQASYAWRRSATAAWFCAMCRTIARSSRSPDDIQMVASIVLLDRLE